MQNEKRTELRELGEFGIIESIRKKTQLQHPSSVLGIGDDAAVIDSGEHYTLVTTDMLLEGIHFDLSYMPLQHLGYKAIAVNVSDIAAMNGVPAQVTVSLGLSNRFSIEAINALYEGIHAACENFKVDLIGGDTTSSASGLVISVTAIGTVDKTKVARRDGANEGDIICLSGDLGGAYLGLQVLEREKQVFKANPAMQPKLGDYEYVVKRQLKPEARMDIIHELAELNIVPTAMIDVSDGLASELMHLSSQSNKGLRVYEDKIPVAKDSYEVAMEFQLDPSTAALNGGEDYELLFTITQEDFEKLKQHEDISTIGYVTKADDGVQMATRGGQLIPIKAQGWKHF